MFLVKNFHNITAVQSNLNKQAAAICGEIDKMREDLSSVKRSNESNMEMLGEQMLNLLGKSEFLVESCVRVL